MTLLQFLAKQHKAACSSCILMLNLKNGLLYNSTIFIRQVKLLVMVHVLKRLSGPKEEVLAYFFLLHLFLFWAACSASPHKWGVKRAFNMAFPSTDLVSVYLTNANLEPGIRKRAEKRKIMGQNFVLRRIGEESVRQGIRRMGNLVRYLICSKKNLNFKRF